MLRNVINVKRLRDLLKHEVKSWPGSGRSSPLIRRTVAFDSYDDQDTRIIADTKQLRIEYHPASDTDAAKTPDDFVTVDLSTRQLVHYVPQGNANE